MATNVALVRASTFFTIDNLTDLTNGETLVIGGKTYTAQDTLTNTDGNVHIGANVAGLISNLVAAINLSNEGETAVSAGTDYAAAMTRNPCVYATASTNTLTVHSLVPGAIGNVIPVTIGTSAAEVDNATLEGGSGNVASFFEGLFDLNQINSELYSALAPFTPAAD
jgi:hypothetical protein